jgi:hypothetical protein
MLPQGFDAVVFIASLHHISPLELAAYVLATERRRISEGRLVPVGLRLLADRA